MSYAFRLVLLVLWMTVLIDAKLLTTHSKRRRGGSPESEFCGTKDYEEVSEFADAQQQCFSAFVLVSTLKKPVEEMPKLIETALEDVKRAEQAAKSAKALAFRYSVATGKSSIAQNAYNVASNQRGIVQVFASNAKNLMRNVLANLEKVKPIFQPRRGFNEKYRQAHGAQAKLDFLTLWSSLEELDKAVEKVQKAAEATKKSADDAQRLNSMATVVASSSVAKEYADAAQDHASKSETSIQKALDTMLRIEKFVTGLSQESRTKSSAAVDAAKKGLETAKLKLPEVKEAARLAEVHRKKVEEFNQNLESKLTSPVKELEAFANESGKETNLVVENENKGRAALQEVLAGSKAVEDTAASIGLPSDAAGSPRLLCGALILIMTVIASVVLV